MKLHHGNLTYYWTTWGKSHY